MMKTEWDYTELAPAYLKRADYAPEALNALFVRAGLRPGMRVCDIGAGAAHLTLPLAEFGLLVDAVEPNDAMRAQGRHRTRHLDNVRFSEGTGENTGCESGQYDLVTFGSSFNVCNREQALAEAWRILKPGGYFACMWNHRDLADPVQAKIEQIISQHLPEYSYGSRREDQTAIIEKSGLFDDIHKLEGRVLWEQSPDDAIEAWRSHLTLAKQAKNQFPVIIRQIEQYLQNLGSTAIQVPYTTRIWMARRKE